MIIYKLYCLKLYYIIYFLIYPYYRCLKYFVVVDTLNSFLLVTSIEVLTWMLMCAAVGLSTCRDSACSSTVAKHEVKCMIE